MGSVRSSVALGHAAAPAGARQAKGLSKTCLFEYCSSCYATPVNKVCNGRGINFVGFFQYFLIYFFSIFLY